VTEPSRPNLNIEQLIQRVREEAARRQRETAPVETPPPPPRRQWLYSLGELLRHDDVAFVTHIYRGVLHREPDPNGLRDYLSRLRNGECSKIDLLRNLRFSPEGERIGVEVQGLLPPSGGGGATAPALEPLAELPIRDHYTLDELLQYRDEAFVRNAYRALLHREPDTAGLAHYLEKLRSGAWTRMDVIQGLRTNSEGQAAMVELVGWPADTPLHPNLPSHGSIEKEAFTLAELLEPSDEAFVDHAYRALLRREPDAAGKRHHLEQLRDGRSTKIDALGQLRYSREGRQVGVTVRGLWWPFMLQTAYRLPVVGDVLALAMLILRPRSLISRLRWLEARNDQSRVREAENQAQQQRLTQELTRLRRCVDLQAGTRELAQIKHEVRELATQLTTELTQIKWLADAKANGGEWLELRQNVSGMERDKASVFDLAEIRQALAGKAEAAHLDEVWQALAGKAETVNLEQAWQTLAGALAGKAEAAHLDEVWQALASKAETVNLEQALAGKAEAAHLDEAWKALAGKAETANLEQALAGKAEAAHLEEAWQVLAGKAEAAHLDEAWQVLAGKAEAVDLAGTQQVLQNLIDQELKQMRQQLFDYRRNLVDQQRRLGLLLEEARKRLPAPLDQEQLATLASEADHILDAMYVTFEDRFRGDRADIKQRVAVYLPILTEAGVGTPDWPIVDIGCGRGEWLELLKENGLTARGIDLNKIMINECQERDFDVVEMDALQYLQQQPSDSLGAVTGMHIIEHLPMSLLVALLDETLRVLRPGGMAIFETPNPENLVVGACYFYTDPTHHNPLPPSMIEYLVEARGFVQVNIRRWSQRLQDPLEFLPADQEAAKVVNPLVKMAKDYYFAAPDYAVIGYKA